MEAETSLEAIAIISERDGCMDQVVVEVMRQNWIMDIFLKVKPARFLKRLNVECRRKKSCLSNWKGGMPLTETGKTTVGASLGQKTQVDNKC